MPNESISTLSIQEEYGETKLAVEKYPYTHMPH